MNEATSLDQRAIDKRIGLVRKKAKLTQIEFAKKLNLPVMITEIAEHGIRSDGGSHMQFTLSMDTLMRIIKRISEKFSVPVDWLMYGFGIGITTNDIPFPSNDETTLFLPVTISDRSLANEMYNALILMSANGQYESERLNLQRAMLESIIEKYRLYKQHVDSSGNSEYANSACIRMLDVINRLKSN